MINDNSSAAFATIQDMTVTHQFALLKIVKENPESTAREIELLSNNIPAPWKRLPELRFKGFVSNPYTRPCKVTGKKAMVWAAA
mgnify:FL=1|jgi:hypothetical protein|tara:strand:- start:725 stop:976 length:252 start_codon:yes stop_codon:yes gene_type:complete